MLFNNKIQGVYSIYLLNAPFINSATNTPLTLPNIAPDAYINLSLIFPNYTFLTLPDQNQLIPNAANTMPG